eukprot:189720-Rhodomonas_salina.1
MHPRVLAEFHRCTIKEVESVPLILDWSCPSPVERVEAGVPLTVIKTHNFRCRAAADFEGVYFHLQQTAQEMSVEHIFSNQGMNAENAVLMGVVLGTQQYLGKGVGLELSEPAGQLFFVTGINLQVTYAQLDGVETEVRGHICTLVSEILENQYNSQSEYCDWLEWERASGSSVAASLENATVLAGQVKCCVEMLPQSFWDETLQDLDCFFQLV